MSGSGHQTIWLTREKCSLVYPRKPPASSLMPAKPRRTTSLSLRVQCGHRGASHPSFAAAARKVVAAAALHPSISPSNRSHPETTLQDTRTHERRASLPPPGPLVCSIGLLEVDVPSKEVNQLTGSATSLFSDSPLLTRRRHEAAAFEPPCCQATSSRSAHYYWLARKPEHPAGGIQGRPCRCGRVRRRSARNCRQRFDRTSTIDQVSARSRRVQS